MEWINTNKKFIAFFDIMGFTNFVFRNPHKVVGEKINQLRNEVIRDIENLEDKKEEGKKILPYLPSSHKRINIDDSSTKIVIFSDSVIFITTLMAVDTP